MKNRAATWTMLGAVCVIGAAVLTSGCALPGWPDKEPVDVRAREAYERGDWGEAIDLYSASINKMGEKYEYFLHRGKARKYIGRTEKALADLNKAKNIRPKDEERRVARARASLHYDTGQYNEAFKDAETVLEGASRSPDYLMLKGKALYKLDHLQEALRSFQRAYKLLEPGDKKRLEIARCKAWTQFKQKNYEQALNTFISDYLKPKNKAPKLSLSTHDYYEAGVMYDVNLKDKKKAQMWERVSDPEEYGEKNPIGIQ